MTDEEMKKQINAMSYEQLLRKWRFASTGDPFFTGEIGTYYSDIMKRKKEEIGNDAHVATSKSIGWEG